MRMVLLILATSASPVWASIAGQTPRTAEIRVAIHELQGAESASGLVEPAPVVDEIPEANAAAAPQGGTLARFLTAAGFLALIAALLLHWSSDTSCREKRSVFSS